MGAGWAWIRSGPARRREVPAKSWRLETGEDVTERESRAAIRSGQPERLEEAAGERGGVTRDRAFSPISLAACHRLYAARPAALHTKAGSGLVETVGDTLGETVGETVVGVPMACLA